MSIEDIQREVFYSGLRDREERGLEIIRHDFDGVKVILGSPQCVEEELLKRGGKVNALISK